MACSRRWSEASVRHQQSTPALDAPEDAQRESPHEALAVKAAQNGHASPFGAGAGR